MRRPEPRPFAMCAIRHVHSVRRGDAMPRSAAPPSLDAQVQNALEDVVRRASVAIARTLAQMTAERLEEELRAGVARSGRRGGRGARSRPARAELKRWA